MKTTYKYAILFILILASYSFSSGQEIKEEQQKHGIGGALGATSGKGLAYKYFHKDIAFQLALYPYIDDFKDDIEVTTGLTFFYRLHDSRYVDLFLYQSNQHRYMSEFIEYTDKPEYDTFHYYNMGVGFGLELQPFKNFAITGMTGFAGRDNFNQFNLSLEGSIMFKF